jgi:hypothetical protein
MEKIGAGGREISDLAGKLGAYRVALGLVGIFLQPPQPEARHALPMGGERLPALEGMGKRIFDTGSTRALAR